MANNNLEDLNDCKRPDPSANPEPTATNLNDLIETNDIPVRVGRRYQANIPMLLEHTILRRKRRNNKEYLVWTPSENISEDKIEEYILLSKEKFGYSNEQALGLLLMHKHNMDKALSDISNYTPRPGDLSPKEKIMFERAIIKFGKNFLRIKELIPDKPMQSLVKYYYIWKTKKKKLKSNVQKAKILAEAQSITNNQNGSMNGSSSVELESDDKDLGERCSSKTCSVCGVFFTIQNQTPKGLMCCTCFRNFRRTTVGISPTLGPPYPNNLHLNVAPNKRQPPEIYINYKKMSRIENTI